MVNLEQKIPYPTTVLEKMAVSPHRLEKIIGIVALSMRNYIEYRRHGPPIGFEFLFAESSVPMTGDHEEGREIERLYREFLKERKKPLGQLIPGEPDFRPSK